MAYIVNPATPTPPQTSVLALVAGLPSAAATASTTATNQQLTANQRISLLQNANLF